MYFTNHLESDEIARNITFFVLKILNFFCEYIRIKNPNYKNKNISTKYLNNMQRYRFLKVKNSLLELKKYFIELKGGELKDRDIEIKREIEELFFKPIIVSIDDMGKFEEKEMKKIRTIKTLPLTGQLIIFLSL